MSVFAYPSQLWHTDEAAEYFQCHPKTIQCWCRRGQLPAIKVGLRWFVVVDKVRELFGAEIPDWPRNN